MALSASPDKGPSLSSNVEASNKLIVSQPPKLMELNDLLVSLEALPSRISERTGEDKSGDMGASGAAGTQQGAQVSARDQAIAAMPEPAVVRVELAKHIKDEVKTLEQLAKRTKRMGKPGGAYTLNEIYSKIRRLNSLLAEIVEASVELLKKLFIRVFIDKQPIL